MVVRNYGKQAPPAPPPPLWRRFLKHPQQVWLRKAMFQIHLWTGIIVGLYIIAIGVSGSILVFKEELFPRPHIDVGAVDTRACTPESLEAVVRNVSLAYPEKEVFLTACPSVFNPLYVTTIRNKAEGAPAAGSGPPADREPLAVYSHPHTAAVLGAADREGSWVSWFEELHVNLLIGRKGRWWNGVGSAILLALTITGLVLWWPGIRAWKRGFLVNFRHNWKRINFDLHNVTGFWTILFTLTWALTGIYFTWPKLFTEPIQQISPIVTANYPAQEMRRLAARPIAPRADLDVNTVLRHAQQLSPDGALEGYFYGAGKNPIFTVYMARGDMGDYAMTDFLYFDQNTGEHLLTWHRGKNQTLGDWLIWLVVPLHFGTSWGPAVQWLWFLFGLILPFLTITGFLMYWNRYLGKRWRALRNASASSARVLHS